ncbi:DUF3780 domain-containing protein (plasmid) [Mesorhizobium mediterraneum]|uniref:DUF3780 domain-containing protein n=1 Tax=Mesorhizobium mediterraneum TaxID=43617 RepID=A0AB36RHJ7_9HYPH|nr:MULTISPECIES: DUF3780 domain-containing protein [Phyllobacteriaceae]MCX8571144.1 DUF3780 domain-containing protein [Aminobacter sp. MET-1]MCX8573187.1 DUF3780 domain-containing protein [Aminobacter sp. MET-1]PAQ03745.1 hypothetical protein CIT25_02800 [Mesorhizobium mediterraneum]WIW57318.1 DUF3780 domain-containing protein [Mesorhizobium mediterraneum]
MSSRPTAGFGVPENEIDPQHFIVRISPSGRELVTVIEDYGISGPKFDSEENGPVDQVLRCRVDPRRWRMVATPLRNAFNERLKSRKLRSGRWEAGDNRVHRLLGREMCVLLWAIDECDESLVPAAVNAWTGLRPEERWWLYAMAAHNSGKADEYNRGWRKAIRYGLTEGAALPDAYRPTLLEGL